jgi:hypothetical protein
MWYDSRVGCARMIREAVVHVVEGYSNFGPEKTNLPLVVISITFADRSRDVSFLMIQLYVEFMQKFSNSFVCGCEKGKRNKHLHIQGMMEVHGFNDDKTCRELKTGIKTYMVVLPHETFVLHAKLHDNKDLLVGYVQKDNGKPWFKIFSMNLDVVYMANLLYQEMKDQMTKPAKTQVTKPQKKKFNNTLAM